MFKMKSRWVPFIKMKWCFRYIWSLQGQVCWWRRSPRCVPIHRGRPRDCGHGIEGLTAQGHWGKALQASRRTGQNHWKQKVHGFLSGKSCIYFGETGNVLRFVSILDLESLMPSPAQSYGIWGKEGEARAEVRGKRICLSSQHFIYVYYIIIFKFW